ncbi:MAG TPA: hypothetical protein VFH37_02780 [Candidatus Saccharimonadales bacterium]|nr:hypothetical protein [Candidatus Saccharimonadales bacterium]
MGLITKRRRQTGFSNRRTVGKRRLDWSKLVQRKQIPPGGYNPTLEVFQSRFGARTHLASRRR